MEIYYGSGGQSYVEVSYTDIRNGENGIQTNETEILFITADYTRVEDYTLSIYNTKGQLVKRYEGNKDDFWVKTKIVWDVTDEYGKQVAPGTYLYKLEYDGNAVVRKMLLIR